MYKDVKNFLHKCSVCVSKKMKKLHLPKLPMQDMPIPEYPFETVEIDTCGPFPETVQGHKHVVTIVDHFSSWPDKSADTMLDS